MINIDTLTIENTHHALVAKEITVKELVSLYLDRIKTENSKQNEKTCFHFYFHGVMFFA